MIYNIQALRALAALLVVVVHLETILAPSGFPVSALGIGNAGVDLFFVVSGFVMVYTTGQRGVSPADFMARRLIRVAPIYWLLTIAVFCIALFAPALVGGTRASFEELGKSLAFIPFMKSSGAMQPVLFVGWTLNYEMFFYAIFALSLFAASLSRSVVICSLAMIGVAIAGAVNPPASVVWKFYTQPIILEFVAGMWIGLAYLRGLRLPESVALPLIATAIAAMVACYFNDLTGERALWAGIPAAAIVASAASLETNGPKLTGRFVQLLGAASYSLYLTHPFVTQAVAKVGGKALPLGNPVVAAAAVIVTFCMVIALAVATYRYVEKPISKALRR